MLYCEQFVASQDCQCLCARCSWTAPHNRFVYFGIGGNMEIIVYDLRTQISLEIYRIWIFLIKEFVYSKREISSLLPPVWIIVVLLHLRVALSLYVILKSASEKLEVPKTTASSFQRWTVWTTSTFWKLIFLVHRETFDHTYYDWTIGGRMQKNSSARRRSLIRTIPDLGGLILELHGI